MITLSSDGLELRFKTLVQEWKEQRNPYSSRPDEWAMCWPYQKIIAMGPAVVPLILAEMRADPDHWFWALSALTDADPVLPSKRGHFTEMIQAWLDWGEKNCGIVHTYNRLRNPQNAFPNRTPTNTRKTSEADVSYNCFGWVIGKTEAVSWTSGSLWPEDAPRDFLLPSILRVYECFGFEQSGNGDLEQGVEKIAIYADGGFAVHAALQTPSGKWSSKLGLAGEDVEHDDLSAIAGGIYGQVACFMKRPRPVPEAARPVA